MSCRDAERIATSSREARVIYGVESRSGDFRREAGWARISDVRDVRYESRYPTRVTSAAYENGYRDGIEEGRADARGRDSFDPVRHTRYRSADHGYDRQDGSKDATSLSTVTASKPATAPATAIAGSNAATGSAFASTLAFPP